MQIASQEFNSQVSGVNVEALESMAQAFFGKIGG